MTTQELPTLSIGQAYTGAEAAAILALSEGAFNERVREGCIKPIFDNGHKRYSGYVLARLLGWPLTDDPRDYMPAKTH